MEKLYTTDEAAELLRLSVRQVRSYISDGRLEASKVGRSYLISEGAISSFLERCRKGA